MSNINISDKNTGDQHTAAEFNTVKDFINSPLALLGAVDPTAIVFEQSGYYSNYTQSGAIVFNATTIVDGIFQTINFISDGTNTLNFNISKFNLNSGLFGIADGDILPAGLWKIFLFSEGGKLNVSVPASAAGDLVTPLILSAVFASNNSYIDITFSEGIYGAGDGVTPAELSDFTVIFAQSGGTATAWTPISVKQNDNTVEGSASALAGGETTIRIFGTVTGTPDTNETLTITPATATSLYDKYGNIMADTETTGAINLNPDYTFANTYCMVIDSDSEGVEVTDNDLYPGISAGVDRDVSFEMWWKAPNPIGTDKYILVFRDDDGGKISFFYKDIPDFRLIRNDRVGNIIGIDTANIYPVADTWYHIVGTLDDSKVWTGVKLYINGVLGTFGDQSGGTYVGLPARNGSNIITLPNSGVTFNGIGRFANLRIFMDKILNQTEVTTLYNAGTPISLVTAGLWHDCDLELQLENNANAEIGTNGSLLGAPVFDNTDNP